LTFNGTSVPFNGHGCPQIQAGIANTRVTYIDRSFDYSGFGFTYRNSFNQNGSVRYNLFYGAQISVGTGYVKGTPIDKIGTLVHEFAHAFGNTRDFGYFDDPKSFTNVSVTYHDVNDSSKAVNLTSAQQVENADSYAGFYDQYYI
jgi:hypothetical protein